MEQMYEISKDVPMPAPLKRHNYPYEQLQVGESFWVGEHTVQKISNLNNRKSKQLGRRFICRKEDEGYRVWRVE
jgi:hypothetical protein